MPFVTTKDARGGVLGVRRVKNLGWLARRLTEVTRVDVLATSNGTGELRAIVGTGFLAEEFDSEFASAVVMAEWLLARRNLRGVEVYCEGVLVGLLGPNARRSLYVALFGKQG